MLPPILLLTALTALLATLGSAALLIRPACNRGWCDIPDRKLKPHARPTPFIGGIAILLGLALALLSSHLSLVTHYPYLAWLALALLALAAGSYDDFRWKGVSVPGRKILLQAAAALLGATALWSVGVRIHAQPFASIGLVAAFILGSMNSYNLEDGMDGLAAGEALISALALCLLGAGPVAIALAGALAGFLILNRHPARVFLGDGGSHLIGALLAALALTATHSGAIARSSQLANVLPASLILGLPILGTAWVIVRRLLRRQPVTTGARDHIYDLLHAHLLARHPSLETHKWTVALCWAIHAILAAIGVLWLTT